MNTLNPNATFYIIRKFLADMEKSFSGFEEGLQRFGRDPGEPWHAAADEFSRSLAEIRELVATLKTKTSAPAAERKELLAQTNIFAARLSGLAEGLRRALPGACPPLGDVAPPDQAAARVWAHYEQVFGKIMDPALERETVQRLLRRAHDPAAVIPLLFSPADAFASLPQLWEYSGAINDLIHNTPLPHFGGLTILAAMRKKFMEGIAASGEPGEDVFAVFVAGIISSDPLKRKAARKALEKLRSASNDERFGRSRVEDFPASRSLWLVWTGVKTALSNPDPVYRRAALCALPILQFTFLLQDFADECIEFIMKGMRDEDGMVRHKTLRFAADYVLINRMEQPEAIVRLEDNLKRLLSDRAAGGEAKATVKKLVKEIARWRQYDADRGVAADY